MISYASFLLPFRSTNAAPAINAKPMMMIAKEIAIKIRFILDKDCFISLRRLIFRIANYYPSGYNDL